MVQTSVGTVEEDPETLAVPEGIAYGCRLEQLVHRPGTGTLGPMECPFVRQLVGSMRTMFPVLPTPPQTEG